MKRLANGKRGVVSQKRLKELFYYDPDAGHFTRLIARRGVSKGVIAGSLNSCGYINIYIDCRKYKAHRLAFLYMTGKFPQECVDHINDIRNDNRWRNLRACNYSQNAACASIKKINTSGFRGVSWEKRRNKWCSKIKHNGTTIFLGRFEDVKDAALAYNKKSLELFGDFAYQNEI